MLICLVNTQPVIASYGDAKTLAMLPPPPPAAPNQVVRCNKSTDATTTGYFDESGSNKCCQDLGWGLRRSTAGHTADKLSGIFLLMNCWWNCSKQSRLSRTHLTLWNDTPKMQTKLPSRFRWVQSIIASYSASLFEFLIGSHRLLPRGFTLFVKEIMFLPYTRLSDGWWFLENEETWKTRLMIDKNVY